MWSIPYPPIEIQTAMARDRGGARRIPTAGGGRLDARTGDSETVYAGTPLFELARRRTWRKKGRGSAIA
jgi:hypothetical protein